MAEPVQGLASMATRTLLAALGDAVLRERALTAHFHAAGGVQVADDIRAGAVADLAVLSSDAMAGLDADGLLDSASLRPLFVSDVVAAVPDGSTLTTPSTEQQLTDVLRDADRIAYSTGPSGTALLDLIERAGLGAVVTPKLVQAPPGTPVAELLARGDADLGFQQRSEFAGTDGVRVLGALPGALAIRTTFSGAVLAMSTSRHAAREVLDFLGSAAAADIVVAAGMTPA